jgi:hypothetical protein
VITSQRGPLIGERIVRGRESECLEYYRQANLHGAPSDKPNQTDDNPQTALHRASG